MLSNCFSILNPNKQKVTVVTPSADAKVYIDNELSGCGKNVLTKMTRDQYVKQIKVDYKGYKSVYTVHYQSKKSPYYIMSVVLFGILFYPIFADFAPKAFDYDKSVAIDEKPLKMNKKLRQSWCKYFKKNIVCFQLD